MTEDWGATLGGVEGEDTLRDAEQLIQQEEEVQTPPRREPRRNEGHQPRVMTDESVVGLGDPAGQRKEIASRHRPDNGWSPVAALENTVSRMQRDLEELDRKPIFEDAKGTRTCAPGAASGTHDDKGTLV